MQIKITSFYSGFVHFLSLVRKALKLLVAALFHRLYWLRVSLPQRCLLEAV